MVSSALAKKVTEATEGEICSAAKKPKLKVIRATSKKGKSARIKKEEEKGVLAASSNGPKKQGQEKAGEQIEKPQKEREERTKNKPSKTFKEFNPWDKIVRPDKPIEEYNNKEIGKEGELLASSFLQYKKYEIIQMNWKCKFGEVDIVARDGDETVLCEVKTRLSLQNEEVIPELNVDKRKQEKYRKLALCYLMEHPKENRIRFDVIALAITGQRSAKLRHLLGAFNFDL